MSTNALAYKPLEYKDVINESDYLFNNISSEEFRTYRFVTEFGNKEVTIYNPVGLAVSESGHRVIDNYGNSHFIPKGWIHLTWRAKPGLPHFVK